MAGETILVQLKGAFNEALVCTSRRVMIAKSGFMTGQMFGSDVFQVPYGNITSAEVKYGIMSGYFQVSAGGVQNTVKSYWSTGRESSPRKAPNCVSLELQTAGGQLSRRVRLHHEAHRAVSAGCRATVRPF